MTNLNTSVRLKNLIELVLTTKIDIGAFCDEFERIYNFELEKAKLPKEDLKILEELFNKVVFYSPFADEREKIPNYLGDEEIVESAKAAWNALSNKRSELN